MGEVSFHPSDSTAEARLVHAAKQWAGWWNVPASDMEVTHLDSAHIHIEMRHKDYLLVITAKEVLP